MGYFNAFQKVPKMLHRTLKAWRLRLRSSKDNKLMWWCTLANWWCWDKAQLYGIRAQAGSYSWSGATAGWIHGLSARNSMDTHLATSKSCCSRGYVLSYETFSDFSVMYRYRTKEFFLKKVCLFICTFAHTVGKQPKSGSKWKNPALLYFILRSKNKQSRFNYSGSNSYSPCCL